MILADTSVWVDHFRRYDAELAVRLDRQEVLTHPFVIGELALGSFAARHEVLRDLAQLPGAKVASDAEVLTLIERRALFGVGIGYVDAHLLAAALLTPELRLWTRDRRLRVAAEGLKVAHEE